MILDPDACIHDAGFFVLDGRTNEQDDCRSWILVPWLATGTPGRSRLTGGSAALHGSNTDQALGLSNAARARELGLSNTDQARELELSNTARARELELLNTDRALPFSNTAQARELHLSNIVRAPALGSLNTAWTIGDCYALPGSERSNCPTQTQTKTEFKQCDCQTLSKMVVWPEHCGKYRLVLINSYKVIFNCSLFMVYVKYLAN